MDIVQREVIIRSDSAFLRQILFQCTIVLLHRVPSTIVRYGTNITIMQQLLIDIYAVTLNFV